MNSKDIIYHLMYRVMLDIRYAAYEQKGIKGIFKLSDLFHSVPLKLNRIADEDGSYDDLLEEIKAIAKMKGYDSWLDNAIQQIDKKR